jgi:S1-C subfamily serine protease
MAMMLRALVLATLLLLMPHAPAAQEPIVLRIRVVLLDAERKATPVPRHTLLVSDNPASAPPRVVVTTLDGTAEIKLRPGSYVVESDRPVSFNGKAYQWTQAVDIAAGRGAVLELTTENAEVEAVSAATPDAAGKPDTDPAFLLPKWQDSVVALWTPITNASGFVIDANGLIATNQRAIADATSVEVQLTPAIKLAATVLEADSVRDVAILWIDPKAIASVKPVPMPCTETAKPGAARGQEIFTIGAPFRRQKQMTPGAVSSVHQHALASDFLLARGSEGGPVFSADGILVGITSLANEKDEGTLGNTPIARVDAACQVVAAALKKMKGATPPSATQLPVEPARAFPTDTLKAMAEKRGGSLSPYQLSASTFDVAFITPVLTFGAQYQSDQINSRARSSGARAPAEATFVRPLMDFSNWAQYVGDFPPVLLVRVTPKLVEGFWTTVGRAAARTQGVAIPPIKRFKSGFGRLRAFCGDAEVTPIHPFKLRYRLPDDEAIYEGLYVFDPGSLGPQCGTVKLVLHSDKEPDKGDTRVVDPKLIQQIWDDFEPYRALNR